MLPAVSDVVTNALRSLKPDTQVNLNKLERFGELTARKLQSAISWLRTEKPDKISRDGESTQITVE